MALYKYGLSIMAFLYIGFTYYDTQLQIRYLLYLYYKFVICSIYIYDTWDVLKWPRS